MGALQTVAKIAYVCEETSRWYILMLADMVFDVVIPRDISSVMVVIPRDISSVMVEIFYLVWNIYGYKYWADHKLNCNL